MYEIIEKKKEDLKRKSEKYKEDLISEYSGTSDNMGSLFRLGLAGGGFILNSLFPDIVIGTSSKKTGNSNDGLSVPGGEIVHQDQESPAKAEFKEKLILILLEILRQILLLLTKKLVPANDDDDIR
jgi:hypothetical protein